MKAMAVLSMLVLVLLAGTAFAQFGPPRPTPTPRPVPTFSPPPMRNPAPGTRAIPTATPWVVYLPDYRPVAEES